MIEVVKLLILGYAFVQTVRAMWTEDWPKAIFFLLTLFMLLEPLHAE